MYCDSKNTLMYVCIFIDHMIYYVKGTTINLQIKTWTSEKNIYKQKDMDYYFNN